MDHRLQTGYDRAKRHAKSSENLTMLFYRYYCHAMRTPDAGQATMLYDLARDIQAAATALVEALEKTSMPPR